MAESEAEVARLIRLHRETSGRVLTIGTVESATAGKISDMLTSIPGSSEYFTGSVVAYSNHLKVTLLGVQEATIEDHGAVSEQTAIEMAQGGRRVLGVDICVSDTGIAGPSGSCIGKPVGLFYFALAAEDCCLSQMRVFTGDRAENKQAAAETALELFIQYLSSHIRRFSAPL